jgi:hypothetical protein
MSRAWRCECHALFFTPGVRRFAIERKIAKAAAGCQPFSWIRERSNAGQLGALLFLDLPPCKIQNIFWSA